MGIVSGIVASSGGTDVSDATAKAYDIKTGKTAYISTGSATGTGYFPAMMDYNGSTGYYSKVYTSSGNKVTIVLRFRGATFTGNTGLILARFDGPTGDTRADVTAFSSDYTTTTERANRIQVRTRNSAGANICLLLSDNTLLDNEPHTLIYSFDADAGTAIFYVDGVSADDTGNGQRVAPTTGTLDSGATSGAAFGAAVAGALFWGGDIGFCGHREAYLTNWSDFMQADGTPKDIDETTWAEWSGGSVTSPQGRPLFWHESGKMDENKGSAGAMTANGTIILAAASTWS